MEVLYLDHRFPIQLALLKPMVEFVYPLLGVIN
jgi:hypothetical protein